jgi:hypothetical protein
MSENDVTGWDALDSAHRALRSVVALLRYLSHGGPRPAPPA